MATMSKAKTFAKLLKERQEAEASASSSHSASPLSTATSRSVNAPAAPTASTQGKKRARGHRQHNKRHALAAAPFLNRGKAVAADNRAREAVMYNADLMRNLFLLLELVPDIERCCVVCSTWRHIICNEMAVDNVIDDPVIVARFTPIAVLGAERGQKVRLRRLKGNREKKPGTFSFTSLTINRPSCVHLSQVKTVAYLQKPHLRGVVDFHLHHNFCKVVQTIPCAMPRLQTLYMPQLSSSPAFTALLLGCRHLRSVIIDVADFIKISKPLPKGSLPHLHTIQLQNAVTLQSSHVVRLLDAASASLSSLCISGAKAVDSKVFRKLASMNPPPPLETITLASCGHMSSDHIALLFNNSATISDRLQWLDLSHCGGVSDLGICNFPSLKTLALDGTDIRDPCLQKVAQFCTQLTTVSLQNCRRVGDAGVIALAACSCLQVVVLTAVRVSEAAVLALETHCPQMHTLTLGSCRNMARDFRKKHTRCTESGIGLSIIRMAIAKKQEKRSNANVKEAAASSRSVLKKQKTVSWADDDALVVTREPSSAVASANISEIVDVQYRQTDRRILDEDIKANSSEDALVEWTKASEGGFESYAW